MAAAFAGGKADYANASNLLALQYYSTCFTVLAAVLSPLGVRHGVLQLALATMVVAACLQYQGHMKATGGIERALAQILDLPKRAGAIGGMALARGGMGLLGAPAVEL